MRAQRPVRVAPLGGSWVCPEPAVLCFPPYGPRPPHQHLGPAWDQVPQLGCPPGAGAGAFICPHAVCLCPVWEHSLPGSEVPRGHPCSVAVLITLDCGPFPVNSKRGLHALLPCPGNSAQPTLVPVSAGHGVGFTLSLHAQFLSEPSRHWIAIETELVKIPCSLLIIEFQRQAKELLLRVGVKAELGAGEQPTRAACRWELAGLLCGHWEGPPADTP